MKVHQKNLIIIIPTIYYDKITYLRFLLKKTQLSETTCEISYLAIYYLAIFSFLIFEYSVKTNTYFLLNLN